MVTTLGSKLPADAKRPKKADQATQQSQRSTCKQKEMPLSLTLMVMIISILLPTGLQSTPLINPPQHRLSFKEEVLSAAVNNPTSCKHVW
jgi:hypothetical protein